MSTSYDRPLVISQNRSRSLTVIIMLSHCLVAAFVVTLLHLPVLLTILLLLMITASLVYYYRWHISRCLSRSVLQAVHTLKNSTNTETWKIDLPGEKDLPVRMLTSSFVSNWLVILNFRDQRNKRYTLLVPADAISADEFRQLKIRVRLFSTP